MKLPFEVLITKMAISNKKKHIHEKKNELDK